jgi:hypothetical protein
MPDPNADHMALRYLRRATDAILAHDWDALAGCQSERFRMEDRRSGLRSSFDRAESIETGRIMADLGVTKIDVDLVETQGESAALFRITNHAADFTVETLSAVRVDDEGRGLTFIMFDEDELDAARAELTVLAGD